MKLSQKLVGLLMSIFVAIAALIGASARQSAAAPKAETATVSPASEIPAVSPQPSMKPNGVPPNKALVEAGPRDMVTLRIVDSDGRPVNGAMVAFRFRWENGEMEYCLPGTERTDLIAGEDGRVTLPWDLFKLQASSADVPVVALHVERGLCAIAPVSKADRGRELTISLQQACQVQFRLESIGLRDMGSPPSQTKGHIRIRGAETPIFQQTRKQSVASGEPHDYVCPVPPGKYEVYAFSDVDGQPETEHVVVPFEVKDGQAELDLGTIDLPPALYSLTYAQTAPEFVQVRSLKDNQPLRLADLRGKAVLLHFSLTYPCTELNQSLRKLYDDYSRDGLEVVVIRSPQDNASAAGQNTVSSTVVAQGVAQTPLIEAVDGGGWTTVEGSSRGVLGATAAAYGVENAGMLFLIDRDGRLVQRIRLNRTEETKAVLERALGRQK